MTAQTPKVPNRVKQPLYQEVFQALRDEILGGRYDKQGALPSELLLEKRFKVSRITIRRACDELEKAALIERSKGRSARVLARLPPIVADVEDEIETLHSIGANMRPEVLHFAWVSAGEVLADLLEVNPEEKVLWSTRLRRRRNDPINHTSVHIAPDFAVGINEELLGQKQLIDIWRAQGHVVASADQIMSAAPCNKAIARHLDIAIGAPVFCIRRLMRNAEGRPMGLLVASLRWDRFSYRMSLKRVGNEMQLAANTRRSLFDMEDTTWEL
ncbi:GntR family transcriptional regulator [Komagataeibacter rhaeticus]|uniref:GntR family transcriptional regulator n=1 Tax=Komagataeibacter rhaeticus TaxID=215221 RepID=A0A181C525_9PROT|nr:GntR family transcriptional regulator [Komagataeibacter rhaeticus]ATU71731.1 GntR family transcriptional regulator [Komagataeibacter xylinus]EGG77448.1 Putative HTH-type transcriptional regulator yurK [Gluconacetobacter sp. SXCC-1]KDU94678.1 hypothetical protein GLUCORHAEAF1_12535 [Komagataeibacter rhaeticus AF1]MBL7239187.1 GntR family transcriptional regulator [Komagataeibacter rhaeticus]MDT8873083.1 GntR family transcriptional regulator [Komagataeibacter rhaeticus]